MLLRRRLSNIFCFVTLGLTGLGSAINTGLYWDNSESKLGIGTASPAQTLDVNSGGFRFGTDITALTATTSGTFDYIGAIYNGTDSFWDIVAYSKGY